MYFVKRLNPSFLKNAMESIGVDSIGINIMEKKSRDFVFYIYDLKLSAMHILKQEALSVGADLATPKDAILCKKSNYDAVLFGSFAQINRIIQKCSIEPFGLKDLAVTLQSHLKNNKVDKPKIMAIVNATPDSFWHSSRFTQKDAIERIDCLIEKNIPYIDIGGASSRPGSELIDPRAELERLEEIFAHIYKNDLFKHTIFSIDTYNHQTAQKAMDSGFKIINDISGFSDEKMIDVASNYKASVVLMHSRGTPKTMSSLAEYQNLFLQIDLFFQEQISRLNSNGIKEIILDIGFGFAKNTEQNMELIRHLEHFKHFGLPLLVGASRKSILGELTNREVKDRLSSTIALHAIAIENGAQIIRVHDEDEHIDMIKIFQNLKNINE